MAKRRKCHNNITMRTRGLQAKRIAGSSHLGSFFFNSKHGGSSPFPGFLWPGLHEETERSILKGDPRLHIVRGRDMN